MPSQHKISLNEQEVELIRFLIEGRDIKEIAQISNVNFFTIHRRVNRLVAKLNVTNKLLLVAAVIINEILPADEVRLLLGKYNRRIDGRYELKLNDPY